MMRREQRAQACVGLLVTLVCLSMGMACSDGMDVNRTPSSLLICTNPLCVSTTKALTLTEGQPRQVFATAAYFDGTTKDVTANTVWLATNQTCADVGNRTGLITAASAIAGACTSDVTASFATVGSTTTVTVTPGTLQLITVIPSTATPTGGTAMTFTAMGFYSGISQPQDISNLVTWHTDNPVLTFDPVTGNSTAGVAPVPGQIAHVFASFVGINSTTVRITVQ